MPRSCSDIFYMHLVYEYLLHMGLEGTAASLMDECKTCNYPPPEEIFGVRRGDINTLLRLFDEEDEAGFFKIFNTCIPTQARNSLEGKKLIADILVYFAALTLLKDENQLAEGSQWMKPLVHAHPSFFQNCDPKANLPQTQRSRSYTSTNSETLEHVERKYCESSADILPEYESSTSTNPVIQNSVAHPCMNALHQYLESECSSLRNDPHFIQYFSLPFIVSPQTHYEYKHIFQVSWPKGIRRKLWEFLVHHRQAASLPDLVRLLPSERSETPTMMKPFVCLSMNVRDLLHFSYRPPAATHSPPPLANTMQPTCEPPSRREVAEIWSGNLN